LDSISIALLKSRDWRGVRSHSYRNVPVRKEFAAKMLPEESKIEAWQSGAINTATATDHTPERDRNMAPTIIAAPVIAANSALDSGPCVQSLKGANTMNEHATPRPRGSGSIYQNGSAVWWVKFYARGVARRESSHSTDRKVAEKLLKRRLAEVETRTFIPRTNVKIDELVTDLLAEYRQQGRKSITTVEWRWKKHLEPFFRKLPADDLNTDLAQRYCAKREAEEASGASINRELAILKRAFHLAMRRTPPKVRSCPVIPAYKESAPRTGFLEDAQYTPLAMECSKVGLWLRALLTTAYSFAFRKGELLSMRVKQVDLSTGTIRLEAGTTKNGEGRAVRMTREVQTLLTACVIGKKPDDFVFTRENGKPVAGFRKTWASVCKRAGVPDLLFHDLRRSGVRNLRRLGVQESVAMRISGHKTRSVFERYNIVDEADLADAASKLDTKQNAAAVELTQGFGHDLGMIAANCTKNESVGQMNLESAILPN
jgi:integrase